MRRNYLKKVITKFFAITKVNSNFINLRWKLTCVKTNGRREDLKLLWIF